MESEFTEKDAILSHKRPDPYTRGPWGLNVRINKNWIAGVGAFCLVAGICVYAVITVSTSTSQEVTVLRQAAPAGGDAVENADNGAGVADETGNPPAEVPEVSGVESPADPPPPREDPPVPDATDDTGLIEEDEETTPEPTTTTGRGGIFDIFRRGRSSAPTVRTSLGRLKGTNFTSRGGREYFGFYNVPYGQPPTGDLRFKVNTKCNILFASPATAKLTRFICVCI